MSSNKNRLGRGLSALLGEEGPAPNDDIRRSTPAATPTSEEQAADRVQFLPLDHLTPSPLQPRRVFKEEELQELSQSIRKQGVLQPVLVRPGETSDTYEIIAGERRWRASKLAGLTMVPVLIKPLSDEMVLAAALIENIQRENLNPIEEATGYQRLAGLGYTQDRIADAVGKSRSFVANMMRLTTLPEKVQDLVSQGRLSAGHARTLVGHEQCEELAEVVLKKGLNVRQTERLLRQSKGRPEPRPRSTVAPPKAVPAEPIQVAPADLDDGERDPELAALEASITQRTGLGVKIHDQEGRGKIEITYTSWEELDDILRMLK